MQNIIIHETKYHKCPYCERMIPDYAICECESIAVANYKNGFNDFINWLCDKYEVFEPEDDGYTLYGDMKYRSKTELLKEFIESDRSKYGSKNS